MFADRSHLSTQQRTIRALATGGIVAAAVLLAVPTYFRLAIASNTDRVASLSERDCEHAVSAALASAWSVQVHEHRVDISTHAVRDRYRVADDPRDLAALARAFRVTGENIYLEHDRRHRESGEGGRLGLRPSTPNYTEVRVIGTVSLRFVLVGDSVYMEGDEHTFIANIAPAFGHALAALLDGL